MQLPSDNPEDDVLKLVLCDAGIELDNWENYSFQSNFLSATDPFSFTVAVDNLTPSQKDAIGIGRKVQLVLDGHPQATGFIDKIHPGGSRDSGATWTIEGRDVMGPVVDGGADPSWQFKKEQDLGDVLDTVFSPYGLATFAEENDANRNLLTGSLRGVQKSKKGKTRKKSGVGALHPHPKEGAFEFASRIAQREGFMLWPTADGEGVVLSTPDFDQAPMGTLRRTSAGPNNIEDGGVGWEATDQPHLIVADGFSGGGEFGKSRIKAMMFNPWVWPGDAGPVADIAYKYAKAGFVLIDNGVASKKETRVITTRQHKVMYLHDDESQTQEQLEYFIRREMSLRLRKLCVGKFKMMGHALVTDAGKVPFTVDTILNVIDEVSCVYGPVFDQPMWTLARTFHRSRSGGAMTDLELILPGSILL